MRIKYNNFLICQRIYDFDNYSYVPTYKGYPTFCRVSINYITIYFNNNDYNISIEKNINTFTYRILKNDTVQLESDKYRNFIKFVKKMKNRYLWKA